MPIVQAVGSGAVDSVENFFINVGSKLPFMNGRRKELDQCLNGKVISKAYASIVLHVNGRSMGATIVVAASPAVAQAATAVKRYPTRQTLHSCRYA